MGLETPTQREERVEKSIFEKQFAQRQHIRMAGGDADIVDIKPEHQKSEIPVLWAPSWGVGIEHFKPILEQLVTNGRRVVSLDHPRTGGEPKHAIDKLKTLGTASRAESIQNIVDDNSFAEVRKALNIIDTLDAAGIQKTDTIAYSEGAINTIIAALLQPERFRNIILYAPAGLIGKDNFFRLVREFTRQDENMPKEHAIPVLPEERARAEQLGHTIPEYAEIPVTLGRERMATTAGNESQTYITKNPYRAFTEVVGISTGQIHDALRELRSKGVHISVMAQVDDPVFPMDRMQKTVTGDMVDGFLSIRGPGHGIGAPEVYAPAMEALLSAMEQKQAEKTN